MDNRIVSGDLDFSGREIELDGYRLPDGDAMLVIDGHPFRFSIGSQPFEQTEIYRQAAKLVDEIIKYRKK